MMGGLLTLYLFKAELNIFSFVGLIVLIGIVKKNAIMPQVDFAWLAERTGLTSEEAIYQGCLIPVPADHDDDGRGVSGRDPHCGWLWSGRRGSRSSRVGRSLGELFLLAVDDAVSDAGGLHVHVRDARLASRRRAVPVESEPVHSFSD